MKKVLKSNGKVLPVADYWPTGDVFVMNDTRTASTKVGKVIKVADHNDIPETVMFAGERMTRMNVIQGIALAARIGVPLAANVRALRDFVPTLSLQQAVEIVEDVLRLAAIAKDVEQGIRQSGHIIL